ncbi:hypothetical protein SAMN05518849_12243 [Sphingobium sp. AP50]|nr:hypothetical protein SAMN05518849_12243 [Sphingobium sp. AP50]
MTCPASCFYASSLDKRRSIEVGDKRAIPKTDLIGQFKDGFSISSAGDGDDTLVAIHFGYAGGFYQFQAVLISPNGDALLRSECGSSSYLMNFVTVTKSILKLARSNGKFPIAHFGRAFHSSAILAPVRGP